jgi:hypothetical protein
MNPLVAITLGIVALGAVFLAVERYAGPRLRKVGPWLVVAGAALCVGIGTALSRDELGTWQKYFQLRELASFATATGFLAVFAIEAVLMSRWVLRPAYNPWLSLATFTLGTFLAWLVTFLALLAIVPGS